MFKNGNRVENILKLKQSRECSKIETG